MDQAYQGSNPDGSADVPVKRKRGRPRKYPKLDLEEKARVPRDQSLNRVEKDPVPPGFEGVNGNQPRQVDPIGDGNDVMMGQVVSGVIEAAFDAGYLLSVRVGNSNTTLRGVVFKPGHYMPVSAENDVVPDIQMIRRNEIPIPAEIYTQVHANNPRSREREQNSNSHRNGTHPFNELPMVNQVPRVVPQSANVVASKGKQVPSVAVQTAHPVIPRVNVVPVVLQPATLPNGISFANLSSPVSTQAAHLTASKSKQVVGAHTSDGLTLSNQVPAVGNQAPPSEASKQEDEVNDMDQPLLIEPLQAVQPNLHNHPEPAKKSSENHVTGKMTELLQHFNKALQENMENRVPQAEESVAASGLKSDEPKNTETDHPN
uniref:AT hook motif-containing protein n=1 Tax=Fagus sylvatica TaxID=28930 RepID=A0A2N9EX36_FAGSY